MTPHIRPATSADIDALMSIFNATIAEGDRMIYPDPVDAGRMGQFLDATTTAFVAEDDAGRVIGGYALRINAPDGRSCDVSFNVAPDARRRGVGHAMGEHALEQARALGYEAVQVDTVIATNEPIVRLLRGLGFATVGTLPAAFTRRDGTRVDRLVMRRAL